MKKITLCATLLALFFMTSCQKENVQEENKSMSAEQKENWLTAKLDAKFASSQKKVTAYLFPIDEMRALVKTPNISEVRFILGYEDHTIQISIVGVDKSGKELGFVNSNLLKEPGYEEKLSRLTELSVSTTERRSEVVEEHLLFPKDAFAGIEAWQEKLNSVTDLDEVTSYEGARFYHFSLEAEVIAAMVENENIANIGLFFGLNPKGKVTTILIGLDKNNAVRELTEGIRADIHIAVSIFDGVRPCPPYGDCKSSN
ncbi:hypothetical protein [Flavobacterium poyangense]|uniref:hypothetical protein n=1 Tax=Flavobacterium poyangense TaxID=2204302 RepID=UPI00141E75E6|nr:hypothetical protein [Flavobacterium sp. JXAS1]